MESVNAWMGMKREACCSSCLLSLHLQWHRASEFISCLYFWTKQCRVKSLWCGIIWAAGFPQTPPELAKPQSLILWAAHSPAQKCCRLQSDIPMILPCSSFLSVGSPHLIPSSSPATVFSSVLWLIHNFSHLCLAPPQTPLKLANVYGKRLDQED